jgi:small subunit ribosomal protein S5
MSDEQVKETAPVTDAAPAAKEAPAAANDTKRDERGGRGSRGPRRNGGGRGPRGQRGRRGGPRGRRNERPRPEFDQKMISIRRVTRVMAGGRRFSFSIAMVIGDKKGRVGVGIGKAGDVQLAIEKAVRDARRHMITVPLNKHNSIAHDVQAKESSAVVMIRPALGRGLVAGAAVRTVLELAGVKDITAKLLSRTKNPLNNARATITALKQLI